MNYELQQNINSPLGAKNKGVIATAKEWYNFCHGAQSGMEDDDYEKWCQKKPDWFRPAKDKLDEIVERGLKTIWVSHGAEEAVKQIATRHLNTTLEEITYKIEELKLANNPGAVESEYYVNYLPLVSIIKSHITKP